MANPKILVVDDQETNRGLLLRWLGKNGFEVTVTGSGQEALTLLENLTFDLVLLDVEMPGVNGLEVLMHIRETHSLGDLPVIMITGRVQTGDHLAALRLGANDYVTKPFNLTLLLARVQNLVAVARTKVAQPSPTPSMALRAGEDRRRKETPMVDSPDATVNREAMSTVPAGVSPLVIEDYEILGELGRGGMGVVYKARHMRLGRLTALKVIRREHFAHPTAVERFYREARAVASLSHPNIVLAYDAGQTGDTHYLAMEYVDGIDLGRLVTTRGGGLTVVEACEFTRQAALGLQHFHERGLVHRDIKPSNLIAAGSNVKIADLGLALLLDAPTGAPMSGSLTGEGRWVGSADFVAPEQCADPHNVDIRADLYGLGCTLYYLLAGRVPFPHSAVMDKILRHNYAEPDPITDLRPEVSKGLAAVVARLMAKRPDDRFQTPAEAELALRAL